MKLTKANSQKLFLTRARLWANVYWAVHDSMKGVDIAPADLTRKATSGADDGIKAFDHRFRKPEEEPEKAQQAA